MNKIINALFIVLPFLIIGCEDKKADVISVNKVATDKAKLLLNEAGIKHDKVICGNGFYRPYFTTVNCFSKSETNVISIDCHFEYSDNFRGCSIVAQVNK